MVQLIHLRISPHGLCTIKQLPIKISGFSVRIFSRPILLVVALDREFPYTRTSLKSRFKSQPTRHAIFRVIRYKYPLVTCIRLWNVQGRTDVSRAGCAAHIFCLNLARKNFFSILKFLWAKKIPKQGRRYAPTPTSVRPWECLLVTFLE